VTSERSEGALDGSGREWSPDPSWQPPRPLAGPARAVRPVRRYRWRLWSRSGGKTLDPRGLSCGSYLVVGTVSWTFGGSSVGFGGPFVSIC